MRALLLAALLLTGCAGTRGVSTDTIEWSGNLMGGTGAWREAFVRKHHVRPVIVDCHGGTLDHKLFLFADHGKPMDAEAVCRTLRAVYPTSPILLISCNEDAHDIHVDNVWFAHAMVWSHPRSDWNFSFLTWEWMYAVGNLDEFCWSGFKPSNLP